MLNYDKVDKGNKEGQGLGQGICWGRYLYQDLASLAQMETRASRWQWNLRNSHNNALLKGCILEVQWQIKVSHVTWLLNN
jgi:hypothetical protein